MEEFNILFTWVKEKVNANDFYFGGLQLKLAPTEGFDPSNYEFYRKAVPVVCSNNIGIGDSVLIVEHKGIPKTIGKVVSVDWEKRKAKIELVDELKFDNRIFFSGHFKQIVEEPVSKCFFPIIELNVDGNSLNIEDCQAINRDRMDFKTVCPKCSNEFRQPTNCETHGDTCGKNNKQQLAFIK